MHLERLERRDIRFQKRMNAWWIDGSGRNNLAKRREDRKGWATPRWKRRGVNDVPESREYSSNDHRWKEKLRSFITRVSKPKFRPKLNCLDEHEARGLWVQIVDCYRPRPPPPYFNPARLFDKASRPRGSLRKLHSQTHVPTTN